MEADFIAAWEEHMARNGGHWTEAQRREYRRFAMSSRQRGDAFVQKVENLLGFDFRDRRVLDVGSAYGGFVLAAASRGASAFGIELAGHLHQMAVAHARGERGDIHLLHHDILDDAVIDQCEGKPFDLIVVNDVFEHVYDSTRLFNRLDELSGDDTVIYFAIPNGESWTSIGREGHRFLPGLSLLDPGEYADAVGNAFKAYYRPLQFYWRHFRDAGFPYMYLSAARDQIKSAPQRVVEKFDELESIINNGPFQNRRVNGVVSHNFQLVRQRLARDLRRQDPIRILLHYDQYFWEGFAARLPKARLESSTGFIRLDPVSLFDSPASDAVPIRKGGLHSLFRGRESSLFSSGNKG